MVAHGGRRLRVETVVVLVGVLAAACGSCGSGPSAAGSGSSARPGASGGSASVSDCNGLSFSYAKAPSRVVPLSATTLEYLFWLGVQAAVVGTGESVRPGTFPEQFQKAGEAVTSLTGPYQPGNYQPVTKEILLTSKPDLVISDFDSTFSTEGAASQADLKQRGIPSYLAFSTDCAKALTGPQTTLDLTFRDLENLGTIMGVRSRADAVEGQMKATIEGVRHRLATITARPTVWLFNVDEVKTDAPNSAIGNRSVVNAVIELAGGRNVFGDLATTYQATTWEEIARRNPDVILLTSYGYGGAAEYAKKIAEGRRMLATNPATRNLAAVRDQRFVDVSYWLIGAGGVRNAEGVLAVAKGLHPDAFR